VPILQAIVLGITQGLSEFLPISSSGHLRLVPWLFGWESLDHDPSLAKTFDVALHLGTLVGALAYFRNDVVRLARAGLTSAGRRTLDGKLAWLLVLSSVPAAITGALFADFIEERTGAIWLIATMLIVFGLILFWADRQKGRRGIETMRVRDAAIMGVGQALALQPGVSRSGATITTGRFLGLSRDTAARFAFLMSLPITAGALLYKGYDTSTGDGIPDDLWAPIAAGVGSSAVTGWLAVWGTLRLVRTRSFAPFVVYRVVVGAGVLVLYFAGYN
jgi:undecaprenyl-diphosphatase